MTVCIGTKFDDGDEIGVVVSADRMVTYEQGSFTAESKVSKIKMYSHDEDVKFAVMGTGAVNYIDDFIRKFDKKFNGGEKCQTIEEVAKLSAQATQEMAREAIESQVLKPVGLELNDYYNNEYRILEPQASFISEGIKNIGGSIIDGLQLLIAGIDSLGAHLYLVSDFDSTGVGSLGYHAIGMGERAARVSLEHNGYDPTKGKYYSTLLNLTAKVQAEEAHGVGLLTDCVLLTKSASGMSVQKLTEKEIALIRQRYISKIGLIISRELERRSLNIKKALGKKEEDRNDV